MFSLLGEFFTTLFFMGMFGSIAATLISLFLALTGKEIFVILAKISFILFWISALFASFNQGLIAVEIATGRKDIYQLAGLMIVILTGVIIVIGLAAEYTDKDTKDAPKEE